MSTSLRRFAAESASAEAHLEAELEQSLERDPAQSRIVEGTRSLHAGRGWLSARPVYYARTAAGGLRAGSSLRALARELGLQAPDPEGLRDYLCYGFVPAPRTALAGIAALPPGSLLAHDRGAGETRLRVLRGLALDGAPKPDPEAQLMAELEASVRCSEASALLLSGGLDSAAVAVLARQAGLPLVAFHARFPCIELARDRDTASAREVARELRIPYRERGIGAWAALWQFGRVVRALDEPLGDPVVLPFLLLLEAARAAGHTRVLTGEGGDQCFGSWAQKPLLIRASYGETAAERPQAYLESFHKLDSLWRELLAPELRDAARSSDPSEAVARALHSAPEAPLSERLRWVDLQLKGLQHIQPRIEAMARACGARLAHPWFESRVLALSFALRPEARLDGALEKPLLKRALRGAIPAAVLERPKAGMGVPTTSWLRGLARPLAWYWLAPRRLERGGRLDAGAVRRIVRRERLAPDLRPRRWGDWLWQLAVLEAWFDSLADDPAPGERA